MNLEAGCQPAHRCDWKTVSLEECRAARSGDAGSYLLVAVKLLLPVLPNNLANDVGFLRLLVVGLVGIYEFFEVRLVYRHFCRLGPKTRYRVGGPHDQFQFGLTSPGNFCHKSV